jgi:hypothetical protein
LKDKISIIVYFFFLEFRTISPRAFHFAFLLFLSYFLFSLYRKTNRLKRLLPVTAYAFHSSTEEKINISVKTAAYSHLCEIGLRWKLWITREPFVCTFILLYCSYLTNLEIEYIAFNVIFR